MKTLYPSSTSQKLKSVALVGSGVAGLTRIRETHEASILSFHGICEGMGTDRVLDWSLHLPQEIFRRVCAFLASNYVVVSLQSVVDRLKAGEKPEPNSVVLTFDDGYASNYRLAWPVLREFNLPATIFVATGFLDGTEPMWFQRLDLALSTSTKPFFEWKSPNGKVRLPLGTREQRQMALGKLLPELKHMPDEDMLSEIGRIERALGTELPAVSELPEPMLPMTWDQVRELAATGLIDFGGHTHTHPIMARCSHEALRGEIFTCYERLKQELGREPRLFAFPNGGQGDYCAGALAVLKEAGFEAACTMRNGRVDQSSSLMELPRYGSPESVWEAEATVSGAFEAVKAWRKMARNSLWSILP